MPLEKRYSEALRDLPHEYLLNLPDDVKEKLRNTTDFREKVEMLEKLVEELKNGEVDI